ncbi:hypothetical protein FN846DRAFT_404170 [Sphaerosporella brunnea]|uniref:C2H2-type domain-containing protein n=1 Tax=Sphaerosporella brunnea TaxID=1250544 RepID=A0A5J5F5E9_9PEZI|nr:hypothetical protein FN846DRAFT_404170 [Sphaerosporella brunnea]
MAITNLSTQPQAHPNTIEGLWEFLVDFGDEVDFLDCISLPPTTQAEKPCDWTSFEMPKACQNEDSLNRGELVLAESAAFDTGSNVQRNRGLADEELSPSNWFPALQAVNYHPSDVREEIHLVERLSCIDFSAEKVEDPFFEDMVAYTTSRAPSVPLGVENFFQTPEGVYASQYLPEDDSLSIDPIKLDREMELFLGIDLGLPPTPSSPESVRSKSSSPPISSPKEKHECPLKACGQSFRRENALQRHIASIHQRTGEICPFCPKGKRAFNRSDNFQRHVAGRHKDVSVDDKRLQACLKRLYQGNGKRTSWKK